MVRFVLLTLGQPYLQIWAQYGDFKFPPIWGQHKSDFSQIVPDNSNSAFFASYAEGSLTLKFELNTAILDFNRFEVSKIRFFTNRPGDLNWCVLC